MTRRQQQRLLFPIDQPAAKKPLTKARNPRPRKKTEADRLAWRLALVSLDASLVAPGALEAHLRA